MGGGYGNTINVFGFAATIAGGTENSATGTWGTVAGGRKNVANGNFSFAAGANAKATHLGSFVWADSRNANHSSLGDYISVADNSFNIRAGGGVHLDPTTTLNFGQGNRQMFNLAGPISPSVDGLFGIGVQPNTTYFRATDSFCWFFGGFHTNFACNPGVTGSIRMQLNTSSLFVNGTFVSTSDRNLKENIQSISANDMLAKVIARR